MTELQDIKKILQQIIEVLAAVVRAEVALANSDFEIVAGTGNYKDRLGLPYKYNAIYKKVTQLKKPLVISAPGEDEYCRECERFGSCPETMEIDSPIYIEDRLIGIISLIALTEEEKEYLLNEEENLLNLLHHIGDLIASKFIEHMMATESRDLLGQLHAVFNSLESGIIATDSQGIITHFNQAAEGLINLKRSKVIGCHLNNIFPESGLIDVLHLDNGFRNREIIYQNGSASKRLIITANPIKSGVKTIGVVASLRGIQELKQLLDDFHMGSDVSAHFKEIIGESPQLKVLKEKSVRIANSSSSVMIRGESGTGKELFARAIHQESQRRDQNFININCAAIPEKLLESELFGYEAGAFSGANKDGKPGKFELADKGTIFLDEIGDMPLSLQAKILKIIQDKKFYRIGGVKEIDVDVRIISATNQRLEELIEKNLFREDLFYRLNVIPLELPPLRERKQDILILIKHFITKYNEKLNRNILGVTDEVEDILLNYKWPGNVRELENVIEYAINMESDSYINLDNLPARMVRGREQGEQIYDLSEMVEQYEAKLIKEALERYGWDTAGKMKAAEKLGIGKTTLYNKLNRYELK